VDIWEVTSPKKKKAGRQVKNDAGGRTRKRVVSETQIWQNGGEGAGGFEGRLIHYRYSEPGR